MPVPIPLIVAGTQVASQLGSNIASNVGNKKAQKRAFAHNVDMWNRANEYNDPSAQMARLKGAGLNPNLVYGTGSVSGNTSTQTPKYQAEEVRYDVNAQQAMQTLGEYQNTQLQKAQVDNVAANTENVKARTIIEFIRGSKYISDAKKAKIEANVAQELEQTQIDTGKQQLDLLNKNISNAEKLGILRKLETELKEKELEWMKNGITKQDSLWVRQVMEWINSMGVKKDGIWKKLQRWAK